MKNSTRKMQVKNLIRKSMRKGGGVPQTERACLSNTPPPQQLHVVDTWVAEIIEELINVIPNTPCLLLKKNKIIRKKQNLLEKYMNRNSKNPAMNSPLKNTCRPQTKIKAQAPCPAALETGLNNDKITGVSLGHPPIVSKTVPDNIANLTHISREANTPTAPLSQTMINELLVTRDMSHLPSPNVSKVTSENNANLTQLGIISDHLPIPVPTIDNFDIDIKHIDIKGRPQLSVELPPPPPTPHNKNYQSRTKANGKSPPPTKPSKPQPTIQSITKPRPKLWGKLPLESPKITKPPPTTNKISQTEN